MERYMAIPATPKTKLVQELYKQVRATLVKAGALKDLAAKAATEVALSPRGGALVFKQGQSQQQYDLLWLLMGRKVYLCIYCGVGCGPVGYNPAVSAGRNDWSVKKRNELPPRDILLVAQQVSPEAYEEISEWLRARALKRLGARGVNIESPWALSRYSFPCPRVIYAHEHALFMRDLGTGSLALHFAGARSIIMVTMPNSDLGGFYEADRILKNIENTGIGWEHWLPAIGFSGFYPEKLNIEEIYTLYILNVLKEPATR